MSEVLAPVEQLDTELVDDSAQFFAPTDSDLIDQLLGEYQQLRGQIDQLGSIVDGTLGSVVHYFIEGNCGDERNRISHVKNMFEVPGAVAALNAAYWSKTLNLTDVLNCMPQKRRDEWAESIRNPAGKKSSKSYGSTAVWEIEPLPEYTAEAVRPTIQSLLNMRQQFLAERVDGMFRGLSGDHVTNTPEGFGKRMIIARVLTSYDTSEHTTCGLINDLRCVIAKFMGREEPHWNSTSNLVQTLRRNWGEWVAIDGNALKIRLYKKGTAHMEVHPDMAWRLNSILAHLYPLAIPAQFRQKPKRKAKEFAMIEKPLPFAVLNLLASLIDHKEPDGTDFRHQQKWRQVPNAKRFHGGTGIVLEQAEAVLQAIGGVRKVAGKGLDYWQFDYDATDVLDLITASGCIPDQKAHQFYPTPAGLAQRVIDLADIGPDDDCCEPEAGQGGLADLMPKEQTTCIEVSPLHCTILRSKGHTVHEADFLEWAEHAAAASKTFTRIVMNPPFSEGRWLAHLQAAASLVAPQGQITAVLPASAAKIKLPGFELTFHGPYANEFPGVSVSVVILVAVRT